MDAEVIAHMAPNGQNGRRRALDQWFPTVVRYAGVLLLFYAAFIDKGQQPALLPTAAGLILFKTVFSSRSNGGGNGS